METELHTLGCRKEVRAYAERESSACGVGGRVLVGDIVAETWAEYIAGGEL